MKKVLNADKDEKRLSNYIVIGLYLPVVKFCIIQSIPGLSKFNEWANIFIGCILLALFIRNFPIILKRSVISLLLASITLVFISFSAWLSGGENLKNYTNAIVEILISSFTLFLTAASIKKYDLLFDKLLKWSPVMVLFALFMLISTSVIGVVGVAETNYNMSLSYYIIIPSLILFSAYIEYRKPKNLMFFIVSMLIILAMGSRGPLLCVGIFVCLLTLKTIKINLKSISLIILLVVFFIFISINFDEVIGGLYSLLSRYHIESRTLKKIILGTFWDDSNRSLIAQDIFEIISRNFGGIGFLGDLRSHNILIENILWFGVIFGMIINLILLIIVLKTIFMNIKLGDKRTVLILVFFSYAIPDALLNLTVWGKDMFWIYIALVLSLNRDRIKVVIRR